ncbi:uncharacterized protein LOC114712086 [Neltuma alba]|uniref:uncharacterized protein LOC114712086 n=1 Tax=Neltuma alba TaxID=207710 RepID=UPI0010A3BE71|nr:uncharacterized protein LOC114712086 [Prosopis alba]
MRPITNEMPRVQKESKFQGEGPNWLLIAAGALFSTLSFRLGCKLKQALDSKQLESARTRKSSSRRKPADNDFQSNGYSLAQDSDGCFSCISGTGGATALKCQSNGQMLRESEGALPFVTVSGAEFSKENGVLWTSSPDQLELPSKSFHHSNCSDSPCVSESGYDIFSRREVIQKLRQQLKRRDDMILEMQDQIAELQSSLNAQLGLSSHLQLQLDAANRDLFDSRKEIQQLRKAISNHCVGHASHDKSSTITVNRSGHANGLTDGDNNLELPEEERDDKERIVMLRRQVGELKEVVEGKEFLLQSYKEHKEELSLKIKELQQRLDSQLPNFL